MDPSPQYMRVMASSRWADLRQQALERAGSRCEGMALVFDKHGRAIPDKWGGYVRQRCETRHGLQLHHLDYSRLGEEGLRDVRILCDRCHQVATVLGILCETCKDPVVGDEADAWRFVAEMASVRLLAVNPPKIIDLAREYLGRLCLPCSQPDLAGDWWAD